MQLVEYRVDIRPFKSCPRRTFAHFVSSQEGSHTAWHAGQSRSRNVCALLFSLDPIPIPKDLVRVLHRQIAENVWVASNQLVANLSGHAVDVKRTRSLLLLGMKNRL